MRAITLKLNYEEIVLLEQAVRLARAYAGRYKEPETKRQRLMFLTCKIMEAYDMNRTELAEAKIELLDAVHELASDPIPDLDAVKAKVEEVFKRLEEAYGETK